MAPHESWIRDLVHKIKRQENERRGAMFELVGTPLFISPGSTVRPTSRNFKGYDATVTFQDGGILDISMKNFGVSQHERDFLIAAKQSEKRWVEAVAKAGCNGRGLAVIADRPVTATDWADLEAQLLNLAKAQQAQFIKVVGPWTVRAHFVPQSVHPISPKPISYQIMVNAPFHLNERQTLIDRISKAATNAHKFARGGDETARLLYIRLHEDADIATYSGWVKAFLRTEPDHSLSAVLLYQPAQVQTSNPDGSSTSHLQHTLVEVGSARLLAWKAASPFRNPGLTLPIGTASNKMAPRVIQHERGQVPLQPGYFYQSGNFYSLRAFEGIHTFGTVAPGIRQHVVVADPRGGITLSPITSPDGRFTLFD